MHGQINCLPLTGLLQTRRLLKCSARSRPEWKKVSQVDSRFRNTSTDCDRVDLGTIHSVGLPIHVYPLYENGFRAHRGQSIAQNNRESARLYAEFSAVAEHNPVAWSHGKPAGTEESIGTVTKKNRMICFPCGPLVIFPGLSQRFANWYSHSRSDVDECFQCR